MPWSKRAFDAIAAALALLILSPVLLVVGSQMVSKRLATRRMIALAKKNAEAQA
jgi:lipopolysaccharide/colanic/teichoic acid biosynthesis glycosyltransferase